MRRVERHVEQWAMVGPRPGSVVELRDDTPGGVSSGTTQVGDHHYAYTCAGARLTQFERAD